MSTSEIIIYQSNSFSKHIEVRMEDETVWLTQLQMVELFESTKQNISLHINNLFKEGELEEVSTVKEYLTVQKEGNRSIKRTVRLYNLDVIISVGYRVKSQRGTLKTYLLKGYAIHNRLDVLEQKVSKLQEQNNHFDLLLKTSLPPNEGIFYDGQIFDAYLFVSDIIKSAQNSIILIDNYIDESVLMLLTKRNDAVKASVYTDKIDKQLQFDIEKHNKQYPPIAFDVFKKSHDRFLIIDDKTVYHIGASIKDLAKKWFAFSKIKIDANILIERLK